MKKTYRIYTSRSDIPESIYLQFDADPKNDDKEARDKFASARTNPNNEWNNLRLVRVDVKEVTTHIDSTPDAD